MTSRLLSQLLPSKRGEQEPFLVYCFIFRLHTKKVKHNELSNTNRLKVSKETKGEMSLLYHRFGVSYCTLCAVRLLFSWLAMC